MGNLPFGPVIAASLSGSGASLQFADHQRRDQPAVGSLNAAQYLLIVADRSVLRAVLRAGHQPSRCVVLAQQLQLLQRAGADEKKPPSPAQPPEEIHRQLQNLAPDLAAYGLTGVSRLEADFAPVLEAMEARGLPLNVAQWRRVLAEAEAKAADARTRLGASVGTDLTGNPSLEPGERGRILAWFQAEGYPIQSTSKHALAAVDHPAAQALLDWREAAKLTSTYEGYLDRLAGGRIFGRFHALGAASGRMSCGHPNLQNIPARLRPCVEAPEGRVLVSADYSGCELRIVAALSRDEALIEALLEADFHSAVARRLFQKPVSKTENPELRHQAKGINFGLLYGMGAKSLGQDLGISTTDARALMDRYFEGFPQLAQWRREALEVPKQRGFLRTRLGRRLAVDRSRDIGPLALNFPVQGGGADLIKRAAVRVEQALKSANLDGHLVNMIHDELLIEASAADGAAVAELVKGEMITAGAELFKEVPMAVDAAVASSWSH
ncbi:MAG: hypothetical protein CMH50_11870 [Myxococcales bacterium]|nr:hypothetical protein [Myxococcales bacterium]